MQVQSVYIPDLCLVEILQYARNPRAALVSKVFFQYMQEIYQRILSSYQASPLLAPYLPEERGTVAYRVERFHAILVHSLLWFIGRIGGEI